MNYVQLAIPFFILAVALEALWGALSGKQTYRVNDTVNSLQMGVLSRLVSILKLGFSGLVFSWLTTTLGIPQLPVDAAWVWVAGFIGYDFCYYWKHRYGHEWRIMWASHVAHHQSEEYNLSTALRQTGTDYIGFVFYLPLYLVGMPVYVIVTVGSLNLIYQFWVHTRHIRRLGPLEWLLVTPSNHRVHHARNPEYIDKNYGGVFIIWDRMFGTFKDEDETIPCVFGITHQLRSWNPVWANLHVWVETAKLSWRTRSVADKFRVWFKGPGWYPADIAPPTISGDFVPFNPVVSPVNRWSSFIQFWVLTAAALALLNWQNDFPRDFVLVAFVWLTGSFVIQGYFLEGHPLALALETGRILLLVVMLCFYGLIPVQPVILPVALTAPYLLLSLLLLGLQWRGERLVTIPAEDQLPQS